MTAFNTSDGCPIEYHLHSRTSPKSDRIVLIHSLALNGGIWERVVVRLVDAADVLTYDCRGHGRSGRRAGPFTLELFARDLKELLDHVGWSNVVVAGCSMGGSVAQAFAGMYSSRVKGLGLIERRHGTARTPPRHGGSAPMPLAA